MSDDVSRARRILADPVGLMLPHALGRALVARIDVLEAELAAMKAREVVEFGFLDASDLAARDVDDEPPATTKETTP